MTLEQHNRANDILHNISVIKEFLELLDDKYTGISITRPGKQSLSFSQANKYINNSSDLCNYEKDIIHNLENIFYSSIRKLNEEFEKL